MVYFTFLFDVGAFFCQIGLLSDYVKFHVFALGYGHEIDVIPILVHCCRLSPTHSSAWATPKNTTIKAQGGETRSAPTVASAEEVTYRWDVGHGSSC